MMCRHVQVAWQQRDAETRCGHVAPARRAGASFRHVPRADRRRRAARAPEARRPVDRHRPRRPASQGRLSATRSVHQNARKCTIGPRSSQLRGLLETDPIPYNAADMSTPPENKPEKSWQARIAEATDALAQSFVESISYDRRLYKHDIAGSIAHAAMLAKVGLITDAERKQIEDGLRSIERDIEANNFVFDEAMEDIHMVVEAELIKRIGEAGKKLHTGRSRNDQVALDLALWLFESSINIQKQLEDVRNALGALAVRSSGLVMPSFTHLQRAQPI